MERIVIIGGGSPYVPGILHSLSGAGETLGGSEIVLMDVDDSRLDTMVRLGTRMAENVGRDFVFTQTTSLSEALEGATFVLTNFRPGGLEGLRLDEEIPSRYRLLGQETTGPGGTFFALRSIPQVLEVCRCMESVCPDAWLVNYVNPTNFVADAVHRETGIKCVALCDGGGNGLRYKLPGLLGVERSEILVRAAGLNHHSWLMELRCGGEDWYPRLLEALRHPKERGRSYRQEEHDFGVWMLERYGIWPANLGYLYPYFEFGDALEKYTAGHSVYHMFMTDLPEHWANFEAMATGEAEIHMDSSKHHTDIEHGDLAVSVILAIAGNDCQEFHVNVPNEGAITNLPDDAIVEVPALIDAGGVRPLCMGALPKGVLGLTQSLLAWEELTVDAALSGEKDLVVQAVMAHPWVLSGKQAEALCEEMFASHAACLPQFD